MSLQEPKIGSYPHAEFSFWCKNTPKLTIINSTDFPLNDILSGLGISSSPLRQGFGNCDPAEATARLEVMQFLDAHPELRKAIYAISKEREVPQSYNDFQTYYDPTQRRTPFWQAVEQFVDALAPYASQLPARLATFVQTLQSFAALEADERTMADCVAEELATMAVIEGLVTVEVRLNLSEQKVQAHLRKKDPIPASACELVNAASISLNVDHFHGYRAFSYGLSEARREVYPDWTKNRMNPLSWIFGKIVRSRVDERNRKQQQLAYQPMVIPYRSDDDFHKDLQEAIVGYLFSSKALATACENGVVLTAQFAYGRFQDGQSGLRIKFLDVNERNDYIHDAPTFLFAEFNGYTMEQRKSVAEARGSMTTKVRLRELSSRAIGLRQALTAADEEFFFSWKHCTSPRLDNAHRWKSLENLYALPTYQLVYRAMQELHRFTSKHGSELQEMSNLCMRMTEQAKKHGAPLCFPTIVQDGRNVIEFDTLYPMHLGRVLEGTKVTPINGLPPINGTMIGLTGTHGGGKTVTEHTIAGNVYLAQSGLPVLGQRLTLNCKTHLGLVFIEGVSGQSVCQVLIEKVADVFKGIDRVPGKNVLLILDELGSATQETAGMNVGLQILESLYKRKVSLLFSTQILGIAEQAKSRFGADCFFVNDKHRLQPGIAGGDLERLVKQTGLKSYLAR